jgi:hypothetical protein
MEMSVNQLTYCHINSTHCQLNGDVLLSNTNQVPAMGFLREIFTSLELDYPKFHKMDGLSKLGFMGVELLKKVSPLPQESDEIAVVFANKYSSLEADVAHQELIEKGTASPAIFVYTLPNIVLGEIAIRNKWYGEQQFFVRNEWPGELIHKYIVTIFELDKAKQIVLGKVDFFQNHMDGKWVLLNKEMNESPTIWEEINVFFDK